jgi:hypothetical protein
LRDEHMIRLLSNAQLRKGHAYSYSELRQIAMPAIEHFHQQITDLAGKQVFLRGYNLRCPVCDLYLWYELSAAAEHIICRGCRSSFQMPIDIPFAYRLNQLFMEGLKQGALTVLLTLLRLNELAQHRFEWQASVQLGKNDVDLIALCADDLILAECKDNFDDSSPEKVEQLRQKLQRDVDLARAIHAPLFLFATLKEEIPPEIGDFLSILDHTYPDLTVRIFRRKDLSAPNQQNLW